LFFLAKITVVVPGRRRRGRDRRRRGRGSPRRRRGGRGRRRSTAAVSSFFFSLSHSPRTS